MSALVDKENKVLSRERHFLAGPCRRNAFLLQGSAWNLRFPCKILYSVQGMAWNFRFPCKIFYSIAERTRNPHGIYKILYSGSTKADTQFWSEVYNKFLGLVRTCRLITGTKKTSSDLSDIRHTETNTIERSHKQASSPVVFVITSSVMYELHNNSGEIWRQKMKGVRSEAELMALKPSAVSVNTLSVTFYMGSAEQTGCPIVDTHITPVPCPQCQNCTPNIKDRQPRSIQRFRRITANYKKWTEIWNIHFLKVNVAIQRRIFASRKLPLKK